jgi:hypothetical protein
LKYSGVSLFFGLHPFLNQKLKDMKKNSTTKKSLSAFENYSITDQFAIKGKGDNDSIFIEDLTIG